MHVDLADYDIPAEDLNPLSQVVHGSITARALVRCPDVSKDTVRVSEEWDHEAEKFQVTLTWIGNRSRDFSSHLFSLSDQENMHDPHGNSVCAVCFDFEPEDDLGEMLLVDLIAEGCKMNLGSPTSELKLEGIVL